MDRLSACYFCSAAAFADRGAVQVTGADGAATVTLCGDCTEKLDRMAETVGGELAVVVDEKGRATASDEPPDVEGSESEQRPESESKQSAENGSDDGQTEASGEDGGGTSDDGGKASGSKSLTASRAAGERTDTGHGSASGNGDGTDDTRSGKGDADDIDMVSVPRETYDKVVRLLQNRTFPVEREAVVSVATSAYGISRRDCDTTLDALVENGVLEESEDGERLHRS